MTQQITLTNERCNRAAQALAKVIPAGLRIYGIPRGGVSAAYLLAANMPGSVIVDDPKQADVIIDDLEDSGATLNRYRNLYAKPASVFPVFVVLFSKRSIHPLSGLMDSAADMIGEPIVPGSWLIFPWEQKEDGHEESKEDSVIRMLEAIGEDPSREGLLETPKRVVKAWGEWFKGYDEDPAKYLKVFTDGAEQADEMVLLTNIPIYSHCEHHITPFIGVAHVAYIPNGRIVGLSKLVRVVETYSRRLQVQERLTNQIATCLEEHLKPLGVAVVITAKHFCMCTRGVKSPNVDTTTSAMRGVFREKPECRAEFMGLISKA